MRIDNQEVMSFGLDPSKGYEDMKRQGTVKITCVDGGNISVFNMYGESSSGKVKIYQDKNNGNIRLNPIGTLGPEDIKHVKEAGSVKTSGNLEKNKDLGMIFIDSQEEDGEENLVLKQNKLLEAIYMDRSRLEMDGNLKVYLDLKDLLEESNDKKVKLTKDQEKFNILVEGEELREDIKINSDLFEIIKIKMVEDRNLLRTIIHSENRNSIYNLFI